MREERHPLDIAPGEGKEIYFLKAFGLTMVALGISSHTNGLSTTGYNNGRINTTMHVEHASLNMRTLNSTHNGIPQPYTHLRGFGYFRLSVK